MDIKVPEIADIQNQLNRIEETVPDLKTEGTPQPERYNLTDACRLKGVAYTPSNPISNISPTGV